MPPPLTTPGLLVFLAAIASADASLQQTPTRVLSTSSPQSSPRDHDELWLASTRHLGCPDLRDPSTLDLDIRRYDQATGWETSSLEEFYRQEPRVTVIYVHGNRYDWNDAHNYGWRAYHAMAACCGEVPPLRFVIWTWPSDPIPRLLRDVRVKAARADVEGLYLGRFMAQIRPETQLSLYGFSYGARVISGGLQALSGGWLDGQQLSPELQNHGVRARAVYLVPAVDTEWLYPGYRHGDSLQPVDRLLIIYNSCDRVLKRYRFVDRCTRPSALGYTGLDPNYLGPWADRVEQYNAARYIGRDHREERFVESPELMPDICRVVLWQDAAPPPLPAAVAANESAAAGAP